MNAERNVSTNWVSVTKPAKCQRCGQTDLAWQQGKTGKWYLCVTRRTAEGALEADRRGFHQCKPAPTNIHGVEVEFATH